MNNEFIYDKLNSSDADDENRQLLAQYLKAQMNDLPKLDSERAQVAYDIAGLLSTKYATSLHDDDILEHILTLAGELEIESASNDAKWLVMRDIINRLDD